MTIRQAIYGGSSKQKKWLPVIDIKFRTSLELLGLKASKNGETVQFCKCSCGSFLAVAQGRLRGRIPESCIDCLTNKFVSVGNERLYSIWIGIKSRCGNENELAYKHYGGRGIKICDEWAASANAFIIWSKSAGYKDSLTIDRIDNDGNYEPGNCRWATMTEQGRNKRDNHNLTHNGVTKCVTKWAEYLGLKPATLFARLYKGWSIERAISTPLRYDLPKK